MEDKCILGWEGCTCTQKSESSVLAAAHPAVDGTSCPLLTLWLLPPTLLCVRGSVSTCIS